MSYGELGEPDVAVIHYCTLVEPQRPPCVITHAYDEFGAVTVDTEHFTNGWHNPYL